MQSSDSVDNGRVKTGDIVSVCWPKEGASFPGTVEAIMDDGKCKVLYDDCDKENLFR